MWLSIKSRDGFSIDRNLEFSASCQTLHFLSFASRLAATTLNNFPPFKNTPATGVIQNSKWTRLRFQRLSDSSLCGFHHETVTSVCRAKSNTPIDRVSSERYLLQPYYYRYVHQSEIDLGQDTTISLFMSHVHFHTLHLYRRLDFVDLDHHLSWRSS